MSSVKKACITSFCIALCYVLPLTFHALGLGAAFSPLHLPVLLCGALCGWSYGAFCGVAGPVISSVLGGMPAAAQLPYMVPELVTYGLVTGLLCRFVRTGRAAADLYLSLLPAMVLGRVVGGGAQALFYLSAGRGYSLALWAGAYLLGTAPGAALHILTVPALTLALTRSGLIPPRYPKGGASYEQRD